MIKSCKICARQDRETIDGLLREGGDLTDITARFGASPTSMWRHRIHMNMMPKGSNPNTDALTEELFKWHEGFIKCQRLMELAEGNPKLDDQNKLLALELATTLNRHLSVFSFGGPAEIEAAMYLVKRAIEEQSEAATAGGKTLMYGQ